jgi:two-component system LytT family response regulator
MIRAYIVDDEEHVLNLMEIFLKRIDGVEVVGRANNGFDALEAIKISRPDVVFLDIEMPVMNGIELAERINSEQMDIHLVFVTAYNRYAVAAFEQEALDYLLKPLELERLTKTLQRLKKETEKDAQLFEKPNEATVDISATVVPRLNIHALGGFDVFNEHMEHLKWRTAKEKELMAYLSVHAGSRVLRDTILDALWEGEHTHKATIYLHTCVSLLRKGLKKLGFTNIVQYEDKKYYLELSRVQVDIIQLKSKLSSLKRDDYAAIEQLLANYSGPLLLGCDYLWTVEETFYVEEQMAELRQILANGYFAQGRLAMAINEAKLIQARDPYSEAAYQMMMRCYMEMGKRDEALRVYRLLVGMLEEMQLKPSQATQQIYEELGRN